ncbi:Gfo/Idh/MocA family protein [Nocardia wallacei]|uniref:Gfo/Idh/MocA family protein n=1 Tax=Nocardia wallacei TaxID=480035 RepID=UPI002456F908|nr:Gfo/Idh/MocA family oxidoreductase [Nocardia wallacei]
MTLGVAVIGAGLAARSHALDIVTDPTMELVGVVSAHEDSAARFADMFGGKVFPDIDAVVTDTSVEAVVVAVPPTAVFDVAEMIDAETPCLIEKPVPVTAMEQQRLAFLADHRPRMVAPFNRRYQPSILRAAQLIQSGAIGRATAIDAVWRGPYSMRFTPDGGTYRGTAGPRHGVLADTGSHTLDLISLLLGGIASPNRFSGTVIRNVRGAEIAAELESAGDTEIRIVIADDSAAADCGDWSMTVTCEDGRIEITEHGHLVRRPGSRRPELHPAEPMHRPVTDLTRILEGSAPFGTPLRDVMSIGDVIIAAHRTEWIRPRGKALGRLNGSC